MADKQQARDPRLAALDSLVGVWVAHIDHPAMPDIPDGRVEYAWALNGRYLLQRSTIPQPEFPDSQSFIAPADEDGTYLQHYFDTRGVTRLYRMTLADGELAHVAHRSRLLAAGFLSALRGAFFRRWQPHRWAVGAVARQRGDLGAGLPLDLHARRLGVPSRTKATVPSRSAVPTRPVGY